MGPDSGWRILRYTATIVSGFYGLYATLSDFHEERNGKRVLSRRGYFGIALLIVASTIGFVADIYKDRHDSNEAHNQEQQRQLLLEHESAVRSRLDEEQKTSSAMSHDLGVAIDKLSTTSNVARQNLRQTATVLSKTEKMSEPLGQIAHLEIVISLPIDSDEVSSYLGRLNELGYRSSTLNLPSLSFEIKDEGFPNPNELGEEELHRRATIEFIELDLTKEAREPNVALGQLVLRFKCDDADNPERIDIERGKFINIVCFTGPGTIYYNDGYFKSRYDLLGSKMRLLVVPKDTGASLFRKPLLPVVGTKLTLKWADVNSRSEEFDDFHSCARQTRFSAYCYETSIGASNFLVHSSP